MKRFVRVCCLLLALFVLTLALVACGASRPVRASSRAGRVVAKVGDVKILYEELYYITMNYIEELKLTYGENALESEAVRAELESFVWGKLISEETALMSLGKTYGLDLYKGEISDYVSEDIATIIAGEFNGDRAAYIESLAEQYMTEHYVRKSFGAKYLASEIKLICTRTLNVADATVLADVEKGEFVCIRQVLIKEESDAAAKAKAERIRAELVAITDVTERCKAMNRAIGSADNKDFGDTLGYGYYYPRGYLAPAYEEVAFNLDMYGVGSVIKADEGYAVIMRMPIDMDYVEQNLYNLKDTYNLLEYNRLVTEKYESLTVEKTRFGARLDLTDLPPIDVDGGSTAITVACIAGGSVLVLSAVLGVIYRGVRRKRIGKSA